MQYVAKAVWRHRVARVQQQQEEPYLTVSSSTVQPRGRQSRKHDICVDAGSSRRRQAKVQCKAEIGTKKVEAQEELHL